MANDYVTDAQLKSIMPVLAPAKRALYLPYLNLSMARFDINTERRVSMYLAQLAHESGYLTRWVENLNYSAKRMTQVWPGRFPTVKSAQPFANNPKALANKVYNGRMGNRNGTDDGWNFRGRGPIQATGREMYQSLTDDLGAELEVDFVANPDLLLEPQYGFLAAAWIYAVEKRCNRHADVLNIKACTKAINGGYIGLAERVSVWERALGVLPDDMQLKSYDVFLAEIASEPVPEVDTAILKRPEDNPDAPDVVVKELTVSGAPDQVISDQPADVVVTKDRPSIFSRVMTTILGTIGTAFASVSTWFASNEVATRLVEKGGERIVENAERSDLATFGWVVLYTFVLGGIAVLFFWLAVRVYQASANRSKEINVAKIHAASAKDLNTVELR